MTNFEKIKQMSAEELAKKMYGIFDCECCPLPNKDCSYIYCEEAWEKWLNEEVKEQKND